MLLILHIGFLAVCITSFILGKKMEHEMKLFLDKCTKISNEGDLRVFKALVKRNMYCTLGLILAIVYVISFCIILIANRGMSGLGILPLFVFIVNLGGSNVAKLEKRMKSLATANHELEHQHQRIIETWRKKVLPDF